jgi:fatty-acyl-CoA synthase
MTYPATVPEALLSTAESSRGEYVFHLQDEVVAMPCAQLAERAQRGARRLIALGVEPGDAVGVLGPNRPEWVIWAFATWIAGAVMVPIQIPLRIRDPDVYREQLRKLVAAADCRRVLADPQLAPLLQEGIAAPWHEGGEESGEEPTGPAPQDAAVIQFSSGSTAAPKGARVSHEAVVAQMELLQEAYHHEDGTPRAVLNWTPFFHDLGLFPNLIRPAFSGATIHQLPTDRFARDPAEWFRLIGQTRVEVTAGPSSAYGSALRAALRHGGSPDLSSLQAAYFGAELVDPHVIAGLTQRSGDLRLDPQALAAAYGLAEAVMAVAYTTPGQGLRFDRVSLPELAGSALAVPADDGAVRALASCGPPLMDVRIVDADGEDLPERHVGEIRVQGPSLMSGYVGGQAVDPFEGGWLCTGDLGYLAEGDLFLTGRRKDMMIAMGQNYYPDDFEWAAARVDGVRPGRCVAFSPPGVEQIVVLVEAREQDRSSTLARDVKRAIADAVGVAPSEVVVLPPGAVEKTTSGKLKRAAMREAYASGALVTAPA